MHSARKTMRHRITAAVLIWMLGLASGVAVARAAPPSDSPPAACSGRDLMADTERTNPVAYAEILAEAEAIPNGDGLLWKIEKPGMPPSYLFGTVHSTDDAT